METTGLERVTELVFQEFLSKFLFKHKIMGRKGRRLLSGEGEIPKQVEFQR